jgi:hypothetical protein
MLESGRIKFGLSSRLDVRHMAERVPNPRFRVPIFHSLPSYLFIGFVFNSVSLVKRFMQFNRSRCLLSLIPSYLKVLYIGLKLILGVITLSPFEQIQFPSIPLIRQ